MKKSILGIFAKFTGKRLCRSLRSEAYNFIKKETLAQMFMGANFSKFESGRRFACLMISRDPTMVGTEGEKFEFQGL